MQTTALADFDNHSLISTINVVRTVIAAAAQPTAAKIADVFGRLELIYVSITFYVVGTIIEASSHSVSSFCAGAVIYQIGLTIVTFLVEVIVADTSVGAGDRQGHRFSIRSTSGVAAGWIARLAATGADHPDGGDSSPMCATMVADGSHESSQIGDDSSACSRTSG